MKKFLTKLAVGLAALSIVNVDAEACTIMLVTKGASADGNVFVSHCDDGFGNDPNVVFVPAKNHKKGSLRPVYSSADATHTRRLVIFLKSSTPTLILTLITPP